MVMLYTKLMIYISMKDIGKKIANKEQEKNSMMMAVIILAISIKTLNQVLEYIFGMMELNMKECSKWIY